MVTWLLTNFIATALSMGVECWTQPMRNIKMNSSDRKMDSTDAERGEWGQFVLGRVHFGKWTRPMAESWYLGWVGPGMLWKWGPTSSFRKNELARWPRANIWAGMLVTSSGGPIRSEKMDSSNVAPEYGVRVGVDSSRGLSHDFSGYVAPEYGVRVGVDSSGGLSHDFSG